MRFSGIDRGEDGGEEEEEEEVGGGGKMEQRVGETDDLTERMESGGNKQISDYSASVYISLLSPWQPTWLSHWWKLWSQPWDMGG